MTQLTRKITSSYTYRWWRDDGKAIKKSHIPALEDDAISRIGEQMQEGLSSGQLITSIRMTNRDPEDGIEYSGWWETNKN